MSSFEYLLLFVVVVLGLAVSELAIATHRLLSADERVKWGLLAPLAAAVAFLKIITQWWVWRIAEPLAQGIHFEMFIGVVVQAALLFLMTAAALPETQGEGAIDLSAHYQRVQRRYWLLFAAHWLVGNSVSIWAQVVIEGAHFALSPSYLIGPAAVALAFIRWRPVHMAALVALIVLYASQFYGQTLPAH